MTKKCSSESNKGPTAGISEVDANISEAEADVSEITTDNTSAKSRAGKTGVELWFHKNAEYIQQNEDQQAELGNTVISKKRQKEKAIAYLSEREDIS